MIRSNHQQADRPRTFVSWTPHQRATAIAEALGATLYCPRPNARRWPAPIRYVVQSFNTAAHIIRTRPSDIFFTNPPVVAGVVIISIARLFGARPWSDSHSGAFNDPLWSRFERVNDWVMRKCAGVIVTNGPLAELVKSRGGRPFVLNVVASRPRPREDGLRRTIVAPLSYSFDEPVRELLDAATMVPKVHLTFTGRAPDWVVRDAPANCTITGWLSRSDYEALLGRARGVICLTSRELTMQMGAFEALEYGIPMLASGTLVLRNYLDQGGVIFADDHSASTLAVCLQQLWSDQDRLVEEVLTAQSVIFCRAGRELSTLQAALDRAI
jgi:glycosyltransferase involved in cell wall biosynthesis